MRNNQDRLGSPPNASDPPPSVMQNATPAAAPMEFVSPTEFVELPSLGLLYPEGHPLHKVENVELRYMTAKEEDILTSKTLLKQGVAIDRLLSNLIVDRRIQVDSLLVGDRNALLVAARISGYGPEYNAGVTCPACGSNQEINFNLEEGRNIGFAANEQILLDEEVTYDPQSFLFSVTLPKTKAVVQFKAVTGAAEKKMLLVAEKKKKNKLPESLVTSQFKSFVVSVNGETNKSAVNSFIDSMPVLDSRLLRSKYNNVMPNLDLKHEFACSMCGHEQDMEVPFTTEFFWPK